MQQKQLEKLKKDTYKVRKAEGRPKHGQTSFAVLAIGVVTWIALALIVFLPEWRTNWMGMLGYPYKRSWGLLTVTGQAARMHHEVFQDACRYFSQQTLAGACASPICLWYRTKCSVYMDMMFVCYGTAFGFLLFMIPHTLCIIWTLRLTPKMIKWAATWWAAQVVGHFSLVLFYWLMTSESFSSLDTESLYPEPDFSFCFYVECAIMLALIVNSMLGITLMKMWPMSSSGSSDSDDEEDEDSDDSDTQGRPGPYGPGGSEFPGGYQGPPPGAYPGPPPPGYGPPPGAHAGSAGDFGIGR